LPANIIIVWKLTNTLATINYGRKKYYDTGR
jgi:hypothetical protein